MAEQERLDKAKKLLAKQAMNASVKKAAVHTLTGTSVDGLRAKKKNLAQSEKPAKDKKNSNKPGQSRREASAKRASASAVKPTGSKRRPAVQPRNKGVVSDVRRPRPKKRAPKVSPVPTPAPSTAAAATVGFLPATWKRVTKTKAAKRLQKLLSHSWFVKAYMLSSLFLLLAVTAWTAFLGSRLQQSNADQLVNAYLFEDNQTFQQAFLPSQHNFLFKWPLFLLVKLGGYSTLAFEGLTVATVLVTVIALIALVYRIERRPLVFGTLCLGLASVLAMVPQQSYAGALLPVGMSMITTRNLEYILYIAAIVLLIRPGRWRAFSTMLSVALLGLLIAGDHLFLSLSLGSGALVWLVGIVSRRRAVRRAGTRWLAAGIVASALSFGINAALKAVGWLHLVGASGASPYGVSTQLKDLFLGSFYAIMSLFTNSGANPAYDAVMLTQIPQRIIHNLIRFGFVSYAVNALILLAGLAAAGYVLSKSLEAKGKKQPVELPQAQQLSLLLLSTLIIAGVIFVGSKHYYAVDARYLGITPFVLFIVLATASRMRRWRPLSVVLLGTVLAVSSVLGSAHALLQYHESRSAGHDFEVRNQRIDQALRTHRVSVLVGDYWRVLPVKDLSHSRIPVMPLQDCTVPRNVLTSKTWQYDLRRHSFAYLLAFDKGRTDYPLCSLKTILQTYGRPNATSLISGTLADPQEMLLYYDTGAHPQPKSNEQAATAAILPVDLDTLGSMACAQPTIVNVVAHQDDDLLFMSPDLAHSIRSGECVRTIYITAGDNGSGAGYWLGRERGSEAAYASMLGVTNLWVERVVKLGDRRYITIARPRATPNVSLVFMRLPDGNLGGRGFYGTHFESLGRLRHKDISRIHSVDQQSVYSSRSLVRSLAAIMKLYSPTEVRTQSSFDGTDINDHSDHHAAGQYATEAAKLYQKTLNKPDTGLAYYVGYPIREQEPNLEEGDFRTKEATFLIYAKYDGAVCHSASQCDETPTYGSYLSRQYRVAQ